MKGLTLNSYCKMNFEAFPYDVQVCPFHFSSWSHDNSSIHLQPIEYNDLNSFDDTWEFIDTEYQVKYLKAACCKHPFPYIEIKLSMKRRHAALTLGLVIPSALLSALSLLSFMLPADSGERISLCITILLTVTLFQQLTSEMIPRSQLPYLSHYFFSMGIALMATLVVNTIVINFHFKRDRNMPYLFRKFVIDFLGTLICMNTTTKEDQSVNNVCEQSEREAGIENNAVSIVSTTSQIGSSNEDTSDGVPENLERDWVKACDIIDRFFLIMFSVMFLLALAMLLMAKFLK